MDGFMTAFPACQKKLRSFWHGVVRFAGGAFRIGVREDFLRGDFAQFFDSTLTTGFMDMKKLSTFLCNQRREDMECIIVKSYF